MRAQRGRTLGAPLLLATTTLLALATSATAASGEQQAPAAAAAAIRATRASNLLAVKQRAPAGPRELRWPARRVNVLLDSRTLNGTERRILGGVFEQLERRTCVRVHRLSEARVSPFGPPGANGLVDELAERNFIYVFKSQVGGAGAAGQPSNRGQPALGLSSLGCVRQGRQSMVLTELAFKFPELVLRYHVMRSLGVDELERPDGHVRRLLNMLPLSQKITSGPDGQTGDERAPAAMAQTRTAPTRPMGASEGLLSMSTRNLLDKSPIFEFPNYLAYATGPPATAAAPATVAPAAAATPTPAMARLTQSSSPRGCLSDDDLLKIKQLYECPEFQNSLSPVPVDEAATQQQQQQQQQQQEAASKRGPDDESAMQAHDSRRVHEKAAQKSSLAETKLEEAEESLRGLLSSIETSPRANESWSAAADSKLDARQINETLVDEAAKHIVDYLLASDEADKQQQQQQHKRPRVDAPETAGKNSSARGANDEFERTPPSAPDQLGGGGGLCRPLEWCPLGGSGGGAPSAAPSERPADPLHPRAPLDAYGNSLQERPMLLKLDEFHAQDPQLRQANQMKLSQLSGDTLATYRLMNNAANAADLWPGAFQQQQQQQQQQSMQPLHPPKSEMLISFEQTGGGGYGGGGGDGKGDPVSALASSQVLKLCSCTCQTMTPQATGEQASSPRTSARPTLAPAPASSSSSSSTDVPAFTYPPFTFAPLTPTPTPTPPIVYPSGLPTVGPIIPADGGAFTYPTAPGPECDEDDYGCTPYPTWPPITIPPWFATTLKPEQPPSTKTTTTTTIAPTTTTTTTRPPTTTTTEPPTTTTTTTTTTPAPTTTTTTTTTKAPTTTTTTTTTTSTTAATTTTTSGALLAASACDWVEWVRPNKSVYGSARIVWDVDRGNENYFLCQNKLNGELLPGKTHGFSCKISQEGRAYETHNFSVLTKPESVNLAWVQRDSGSFGRTNFPVVGGYSKQQDPYIVARCLVKDENNDIVTLIGYINNQGVGWFPFDDIQIECAQYDVLACVN